MGHQDGSTDIDPDKIRPANVTHTHTHTHIHVTDICSVFDSESIGIREGGSTSFL